MLNEVEKDYLFIFFYKNIDFFQDIVFKFNLQCQERHVDVKNKVSIEKTDCHFDVEVVWGIVSSC